MPFIDTFGFIAAALLLGLVVGGGVGWTIARRGRATERRDWSEARGALQRERDAYEHRLDAAGREQLELRVRIEQLVAERAELAARAERVASLEATLGEQAAKLRETGELAVRRESEARAAAERLKDLHEARERMRVEFQNLAQQILEEKAQRFSERNHEQLGHLLNPLREQIGDFRKLVSDSYEKEGQARTVLQTELKQLLGLNQKLADEARSLTRALTTDNRTQGYWGELKLERLLESASLEKGVHFKTQESYRDADGDRYRPDAVLLLPEDRHIVIDAKMNLLDYQRACDAVDDEEREGAMQRHAVAMRSHMRQLGEKDYSRLQALNSPELVLMFIPVEAAFLEAMRRDASLYDEAFARRIVLVGPSNLLASLQLVAQMWRTEQRNRNTQKIMERAAALYDKFVGFVTDLDKVRSQFQTTQNTLEGAWNKLSSGKGNLLRRAEELRRLGVSPSKKLEAGWVDEAGDEDAGTGEG